MTKQKKIVLEKQIEAYIYLFISQREYFRYWEDYDIFYSIAISLQCSPHRVKRVFWKNLYPLKKFREWLENFEY
jgi:hypothetical protein